MLHAGWDFFFSPQEVVYEPSVPPVLISFIWIRFVLVANRAQYCSHAKVISTVESLCRFRNITVNLMKCGPSLMAKAKHKQIKPKSSLEGNRTCSRRGNFSFHCHQAGSPLVLLFSPFFPFGSIKCVISSLGKVDIFCMIVRSAVPLCCQESCPWLVMCRKLCLSHVKALGRFIEFIQTIKKSGSNTKGP